MYELWRECQELKGRTVAATTSEYRPGGNALGREHRTLLTHLIHKPTLDNALKLAKCLDEIGPVHHPNRDDLRSNSWRWQMSPEEWAGGWL